MLVMGRTHTHTYSFKSHVLHPCRPLNAWWHMNGENVFWSLRLTLDCCTRMIDWAHIFGHSVSFNRNATNEPFCVRVNNNLCVFICWTVQHLGIYYIVVFCELIWWNFISDKVFMRATEGDRILGGFTASFTNCNYCSMWTNAKGFRSSRGNVIGLNSCFWTEHWSKNRQKTR